MERPAAARFAEKLNYRADGCIEWIGARNQKGYGVFHLEQRRNVFAHRYAFQVVNGPVPAGMELDHLCCNRECVNVAHLEPVSHSENLRRARARKVA